MARENSSASSTATGCRATKLAAAAHSFLEKLKQCDLQRLRSGKLVVADPELPADGLQGGPMRLELPDVSRARRRWIYIECARRFHILEQRGRLDPQVQLRGVDDVKHVHFVSAGRQGNEVLL